MATYKLVFHKLAQKEWNKPGSTLQEQFYKILARRLEQPHVPSAALSGMPDCYKIKLRESGCRLVYRVEDGILYVFVLAVGRRDKNEAYLAAERRQE